MKHFLIAITFALATVECTSQKKYPVIDSDASLARELPALSNWGKWKETDELGTLNYITPVIIANAAASVRKGITITLARKVSMRTEGMREPKYQMQKAEWGTRDYLGAVWHGFAQTHLDALCHVFADSARMYNGISTGLIDTNGCNRLGIDRMAEKGISGRGVLIDIAHLKGSPLEPGTPVTIEDIEKALKLQGTMIKSGDIVFIRTGAGLKNTREKRAGLHPQCLFWIKEKEISLLGCDGDSDVAPLAGFDRYASAFHAVAIPWLGLPLIDNAALDELSNECIRQKQWTFFVVIAPWKIQGATSAPVNPVAVF